MGLLSLFIFTLFFSSSELKANQMHFLLLKVKNFLRIECSRESSRSEKRKKGNRIDTFCSSPIFSTTNEVSSTLPDDFTST